MQKILPPSLLRLANACNAPLYIVGGSVRDHLAGLTASTPRDWDICSPTLAERFVEIARGAGFTVQAVYKNTGTVKLSDGENNDFEYSCFRSDKYIRGLHTPVEITFTTDITLDARRRDFTVNAIYYDIAKGAYADPLGGIADLREKRLSTVAPAEKVFGEDGLRLMRLARFSAQLGFRPDADCLQGATANAKLLRDVSPERIFAELTAILCADERYGVPNGHYIGLKVLDETRVLDEIFPALTRGRGMQQRADYHKYDVLEHSLRAASYAPQNLRLIALLHDLGKPFCKERDGNSYAHPEEGARLAVEALSWLKAPKRLLVQAETLIRLHMYDFDCQTGENKLRRFFATHGEILDDLLALKQADYSACTDDLSPAPTVEKWKRILQKMQAEGAPLTLKQLAVTGKDLLAIGIPAPEISKTLTKLLTHASVNPKDNQTSRLLFLARKL